MCERISLLWSYQFRGGKLCSAELFFATSSFASSHAELFRPIRSVQAVQNCRKFKYVIVQAGRATLPCADFISSRPCRFHFISSRPFKHYYCVATASHIQAVQAGRSSRPFKHYYCRPFKQAVQISLQAGRGALLLRRHYLSWSGRCWRQRWSLF